MKFLRAQPMISTFFHIDWDWFERNNLSAIGMIRHQLSQTYQERFADGLKVKEIDYVDPETAEVLRIDNMREAILAHCQWEPDYISTEMPLAQSIFRIFLANNNQQQTVIQLAERLGRRDTRTILRALTASGVQYGIVPATQ